MNTAYTLADCSRDRPTRERPGEKQDLAYVSAVPWERQIKESFVAYSQEQQLDSEWTLHLSPTEAAGPRPTAPDSVFCSHSHCSLAPGPLQQQLGPTWGWSKNENTATWVG